MKKKCTNYILILTIALCFISSLIAFVYTNVIVNEKLSTTNNLEAQIRHNYINGYMFARNISGFLLAMGIITAILVLLLTKRIFKSSEITKYKAKERELQLTNKNIKLENI